MRTEALFRDQSYLTETEANVVGLTERGGIVLDRTIFYATSGGQPGDVGTIILADGTVVAIAGTLTGETKDDIVHVPAAGAVLPTVGDVVKLHIDWERRHRLMRMHTACHLLTVACPFPITGAAVAEDDSRVDFDMPDAGVTREAVTEALQRLVEADHPVYAVWVDEAALVDNPGLVKSKNVRPPTGSGRIRLVCIGNDAAIDSQPCGGTHVRSTSEIGPIHVAKIEKKGRENRRFRLRFGAAPGA